MDDNTANCIETPAIEKLSEDCIIEILRRVTSQAGLECARVVCKGWHNAVIGGEAWRSLVERICPRAASDISIADLSKDELDDDSGNRGCFDLLMRSRAKKARVLRVLCHLVQAPPSLSRNILFREIHASSTDQRFESIGHTLLSLPQYDRRMSYWSSKGSHDRNKPEKLTYWLQGSVCLVQTIGVRPFKATFQPGEPIYASRQVRFRFGYSKKGFRGHDISTEPPDTFKYWDGPPPDYSEFVWGYESQVFNMEQEDTLQFFTLPEPVLVLGGVIQVELIGRTQVQALDMEYYICICHVCVQGHVLSPLTCVPSPKQPGVTLDLSDPESSQRIRDGALMRFEQHLEDMEDALWI